MFKDFSPAKLSSKQIAIILKIVKDFFTFNFVSDANHHYPGNIQKLFLWQIVLAANHHYHETIPNFSRLQNCLRRNSSLSPQFIISLKLFKDFFDCKIVLAANHLYPETIQRTFRLQNCLRRKSSLS